MFYATKNQSKGGIFKRQNWHAPVRQLYLNVVVKLPHQGYSYLRDCFAIDSVFV